MNDKEKWAVEAREQVYKAFGVEPKDVIQAFDRMLDVRRAKGLPCDRWYTGLDVFRWWMEDGNLNGQLSLFDEDMVW